MRRMLARVSHSEPFWHTAFPQILVQRFTRVARLRKALIFDLCRIRCLLAQCSMFDDGFASYRKRSSRLLALTKDKSLSFNNTCYLLLNTS